MNFEVYKHFFSTYGKNPLWWVGFCGALFRYLIFRIYVVVLMARITTSVAEGDFVQAKIDTLQFFVVFVVGSLIIAGSEYLYIEIEQNQYSRLMLAYYDKLINKDLSFYRDNQTGYLASTYRQYLDSLIQLSKFLRGQAIGTVVTLLVPPFVLVKASPSVGLVAMLVIVVQIIYVMWFSKKADKYRKITHEAYRKLTAEVSDQITNIVAFKSGGVEHFAREQVRMLGKAENDAFVVRSKLVVLLDLPRNIITAFGVTVAVFLIVGSPSAINAQSLGLIVLTLTYMFEIVRNVGSLPDLITTHDDYITKIYPALQYLKDDHITISDPANPVELVVKTGEIHIDRIGFSYPSRSKSGVEIPVFSDLDIKIAGGEQVGLVGLSGAGKSTLASLLLRFDDVQKGAIKIDGVDIRKFRQSDLRKQIAYVPQEPLLFHRTIKENIAYYNAKAKSKDVILAAKAVHAHEFIEKLPDGYETVVGERGIKLSGGQKQRVAIARAILKKAPIMIFDEATSALDSETEQIIQRALPEILGRQTALVIAHRLSTVAGLDRIIVMHDGKIVEMGSHAELLDLKGRYYALWQKQTAEFGVSSL